MKTSSESKMFLLTVSGKHSDYVSHLFSYNMRHKALFNVFYGSVQPTQSTLLRFEKERAATNHHSDYQLIFRSLFSQSQNGKK